MKVLIFNSGIGKRLGKLTENNPKSLVKLENGESIFHRQLRVLQDCGLREFVITTGPFPEQIIDVTKEFDDCHFEFVHSDKYAVTNYIYSMYLTRDLFDDDFITLHGDLVFNKELVEMVLNDEHTSACLYNPELPLPEKDFKCRLNNGNLKEVSVNIFGDDCYTFQPLYKLSKETLGKWTDKVVEFINEGNDKVYAENAMNEISDTLDIYALNYRDHYINEIDDVADLSRVSKEIEEYESR